MRIGSLFSGAGGLDMAVQSVFGGEIVWHSEIDKAASKVLEYRFPGVPNLGDITKINWANWKPMLEVDVLCGGFPCTDVSAAGKRAGMHGTRSGLWSHMAEAIDVLRPRFVVIENVRGLLNANANRPMESEQDAVGNPADRPVLRAIGAVLGDLADIGIYEARWVTVAASRVGAPHRRERVFIVACASDTASDRRYGRPGDQLPVGAGDLRRLGGQGTTAVGDGGGIHAAVSGDEPGVALLPTPRNTDGERGPSAESGGIRPSGQARQKDLNTVTVRELGVEGGPTQGGSLLPTPTAQSARHGAESRYGGGNGDVSNLWQIAHLLPAAGGHVGGCDECGSLVEPLKIAPNAYWFCNACLLWLKEQEPILLQTPTSRDHKGRNQRGDYTCLPGALLPRPSDNGCCEQCWTEYGASACIRDEYGYPIDRWGKYAPAIARWEAIVGPAPSPTEPNKNGNPRLSAAFSEWLMGWPSGWVTDPDIGISRNDQLRIVGNGVCPQQAAAALRYLIAVQTKGN